MSLSSKVLAILGNSSRAGGIAFASLGLAMPGLAACGGPPQGELELSRLDQPIIGGVVDDEEHPEVMLLENDAGFICTGTVIEVQGDTAFLLTAAHCVVEEEPDETGAFIPFEAETFQVIPGSDFEESTTAFEVEAVTPDASYDGNFTGDVAVVRFSIGDQPAPAFIPPLFPDEDALVIDDELLLVGFGVTETDERNSERRQVEKPLFDLDETLLVFNQDDARGACFGDSGGPVLVEVDGEERVAGVISGGVNEEDTGCAGGFGVAMRASGHQKFIISALVADQD